MQRGFTLIELLIVIAILAILTTVVLLVINPAQLLAESRDAQRLSDLDTLRTAINYYLVTATSTNLGSSGTVTVSSTCPFGTVSCVVNATTSIDGNGWVTIDLRQSTGGSRRFQNCRWIPSRQPIITTLTRRTTPTTLTKLTRGLRAQNTAIK